MRRNLIWLLSICLLLTGCWDQAELSTVTLVTGMAIDKGESGDFILTVSSINAAELNEQTAQGNAPSAMVSLKGKTIAELTQKMNIGFSKKLLYSHMKVLVISREIAKDGMFGFLDFLERNRELRDDFYVVLAKEGEAKDILTIPSILQKDPALKLDSQLEQAAKVWGLNPNVRLNTFISALTSPGRQPVLAALKIKGDAEKGNSVDNLKKPDPEAGIKIDSMGIFRDEKLIGFLSEEDTRNYLWTQNNLQDTVLTVPCGKNKYLTVKIIDSVTKTKGKMKNGQPHIRIDIYIESFLNGSNCGYPLDKPNSYWKIEKQVGKFVKEEVGKTIKMVQNDYGVDIFGFGDIMYQQEYQQYKKIKDEWDKAFQDAIVEVHTNVLLKNTGIRTKGVFERMP